ncbi:MAG: hypothetical protein R3348_05845, partial [Xanthomonadales bacterium]|nr:hypothetical protein [Xanthomonadales bacterium]
MVYTSRMNAGVLILRFRAGLLRWLFATSLALPAHALELSLEVDGIERQARVYEPSEGQEGAVPLLLAFHGYDDDRHRFSRYVDLHKEWPEALVVYPQGLRLPDAEGQLHARGWQYAAGLHGDRDLRFIDTLLATLADRYQIDRHRVHATGMSNGGRFTFLLWAERAQRFAGIAPVAIAAGADALSGIS